MKTSVSSHAVPRSRTNQPESERGVITLLMYRSFIIIVGMHRMVKNGPDMSEHTGLNASK